MLAFFAGGFSSCWRQEKVCFFVRMLFSPFFIKVRHYVVDVGVHRARMKEGSGREGAKRTGSTFCLLPQTNAPGFAPKS